MILVDTSVWVDHLRGTDDRLAALLRQRQVLVHPFVAAEIALGKLRQRRSVMRLLLDLPRAAVARDDELLAFIEAEDLGGAGIGYVDAHLLATARLMRVRLWTRDKRLAGVAVRLAMPPFSPH